MQLASRPERLAPLRRDEQIAGTFGIRRARPADGASAPAVSLWRLPRTRSLLALVFLATFAALVAGVARVYTDLLWFQELGHERVLWTTLKSLPRYQQAARHWRRRPRRREPNAAAAVPVVLAALATAAPTGAARHRADAG